MILDMLDCDYIVLVEFVEVFYGFWVFFTKERQIVSSNAIIFRVEFVG